MQIMTYQVKFEKSRKDKSGNWLYRKTCCVDTAATKRCRDYLNIIKFEIYILVKGYTKSEIKYYINYIAIWRFK